MDSTERFDILNKLLGYGSLSARIVFLGIEEHGDWSINTLLGSNKYPFLESILSYPKLDICAKIDKINLHLSELKQKNIYDTLDNCLSQIQNSISLDSILPTTSLTPTPYSPTVEFQLQVSKFIQDYDSRYCVHEFAGEKDYCPNICNEICINYYPIGRNSFSKNYDEYLPFFGLTSQQRFIDNRKVVREELLIKYLKKHIESKSFIFILGRKIWDDLMPLIDKNIKFESRPYKAGTIKVNKEYKILFLYHPAARRKYRPEPDDICKILDF